MGKKNTRLTVNMTKVGEPYSDANDEYGYVWQDYVEKHSLKRWRSRGTQDYGIAFPKPEEDGHRFERIIAEIELAENFTAQVHFDKDRNSYYYQIRCWRQDVITGKWDFGYGGKAYLSPHSADGELVQIIFGLYKGYWEHEARESFKWGGRRVFGPHIATEALWEVAQRVDVRSAKHVEDTPDKENA